MKKIITFCLFLSIFQAFGAIEELANCNIDTSCDSCFRETQYLYTCNPQQSSCQKDTVTGLNDIATNVAGGDKVMYQENMGTYDFERLQTTTDWTMSSATLGELFEVPQAYLTPASVAGLKGYQYFATSEKYGHLLPVGTSVLWTQMKTGAWLRPDVARTGTQKNSPAYKVLFSPRLCTSSTTCTNHNQCIFYYVSFCGDGTKDDGTNGTQNKGEQCDDGNMVNGDGCSNTCQTETVSSSCTSLTINSPVSATVTGGGDLTLTCTGSGTITSYSIVVKKPDGSDLRTFTSSSGTVTIPATPTGTYTAKCFVNGQASTPTACQKDLYNNAPEVPAVCYNLDVSDQTISTGGSISYECKTAPLSPPAGTTYSIKKAGTQISTTREGVTAFPTAGTYTLSCAVNGASVIPACEKSITVTTPQPILPVCDNLDLITSGALTYTGGTITAVCSGTNTDAYKFILKQGSTTLDTIDYQSSASKTFTIPGNTAITSKDYSVECFAKNAQNAGVTSGTCNKNLTISGAPVCNSLSVSTTSTTPNTLITYVCDASNATSYNILNDTTSIGTTPTGSMNFPTAGTYTIKCIVDNKTPTPNACIKTINITTPPPNPIPSIFIDKDDSTSGTPDDDGNDIQRVQNNGTATFTVRFTNNGNEALKNVVITDQYASDCNRTSSQTASLYAGGTTANFDVSESFSYTCTKTNITSSTFPNNRNTASITGVGVTSSQNVADSDITEIFMKQSNPNIKIEKNDNDNFDDEQEADEDGTAEFSVKVTNNGNESLENLRITDELTSDCEKDTSETRRLIENIGDHDSIFDPGEAFTYTCEETGVTSDTFPDETNTVCVDGRGVDTDQNVDDCDDTNIIMNRFIEEPSICEYIESSEGSFGGAPFRTGITCQTSDSSSTCQIEVSKNGDIVNTYNDCTKVITFSTPGEYSVACIVDDERASECEMGITVEAMTDIPTGTKIFIIIFLSFVFSGLGTYIYAHKRKPS